MTPVPRGYRICGDNIDKTIRRRFMRSDRKNLTHPYTIFIRMLYGTEWMSLPYRILWRHQHLSQRSLQTLLSPQRMTTEHCCRIIISTIVSRILVSYLCYFNFTFEKDVNWHIDHRFSQEMSQQSTFVSDP